MSDVADRNARLRALALEAKSILLEAIRAGRELTPAEHERFGTLLDEKARIESEGP